MATPTPSLTAPTLDARLAAFTRLAQEGATASRVSPDYVTRVEQALSSVEAQTQLDTRAATATWIKGGFLGLGGSYRDSAGATVPKGTVEAAKAELVPADGMVRSTLRGLLERHRETNRTLGRTPSQWERDLETHRTAANAALEKLRGGDQSAAAVLTRELTAIRDTLKGAAAEVATDTRALAELNAGVDGFERVANDTGVFERRTEERAALALARSVTGALRDEPAQEQRIAARGPEIVRPLAIGQLQHDPAFAQRNYPGVTSQIAGWDEVSAAAGTTRDRAASLRGAVGSFESALVTVAQGPATIQQLDANIGQARAQHEGATRAVQQARQQHASTARNLQFTRAAADTALVLSINGVREARGAMDDFDRQVDARSDEIRTFDSQISSLEREIREADSSNGSGNALPGSGPSGNRLPGSGGNALPGGQSGNSLPGGSSTRVDTGPMRRRLSDLESRRSESAARLSTARQHFNEAQRAFQRAEAGAAASSLVVNNIIGEMRNNDAYLDGYERSAESARVAYNDSVDAREQAVAAINNANQTIAQATPTITARANEYNASVTALTTVVGRATVGDEGRTALTTIPAQPFSAAMIANAVQAGARGGEAMRGAADALSEAAGRRVQLSGQTRQRLAAQAEELITTRVRETLN